MHELTATRIEKNGNFGTLGTCTFAHNQGEKHELDEHELILPRHHQGMTP